MIGLLKSVTLADMVEKAKMVANRELSHVV
jgi:hypothetical protein